MLDKATAIAQARSKLAAKQEHKRQREHHRREAKRLTRELEEFCREHRIEFVLEERGQVMRSVSPEPELVEGRDGELRVASGTFATIRIEQ